ncbi:hypothetical protein E2C01_050466 [Portunus trituberculatus]|uniref:Uncharacterized protein n=1 Tax=Portunus trituberculatus TaxID=210409 RepID=A0A5B7GGG8_PORTR|nr:hypothetical protein [Portunus trituberculatus]
MGQKGHFLENIYTTLVRWGRITLAERCKAAHQAFSELIRPPSSQSSPQSFSIATRPPRADHRPSQLQPGLSELTAGLLRCNQSPRAHHRPPPLHPGLPELTTGVLRNSRSSRSASVLCLTCQAIYCVQTGGRCVFPERWTSGSRCSPLANGTCAPDPTLDTSA